MDCLLTQTKLLEICLTLVGGLPTLTDKPAASATETKICPMEIEIFDMPHAWNDTVSGVPGYIWHSKIPN